MKSELKKLDETTVELTVIVEGADFKKTVDNVYESIAKEIKVDGFRKGKVPRAILKQKAGIGYISNQVTQEVVSDNYQSAALEKDLKVMAQPEIKVNKAFNANNESENIEFVATVTVRPEIKLPNIEGRTISVEQSEPTKEQIQERIALIRKNSATKDENGNIEEPDDEELFSILGVENKKEFEDNVKKDLKMVMLSQTVAAAGDKVIDLLLSEIKFDLPEKVLSDTVDSFIKSNYQGETAPTPEQIKETTKRAEHDIRSQVLLDTYADSNDIKVSQNEVINYVANMASQYGIDPQQFIQMLLQNGQLPSVSAEVSRSKTLAHMLRRMKVVDQKGTEIDLTSVIGVDETKSAAKSAAKSPAKTASKKVPEKTTKSAQKKSAEKSSEKSASKTTSKSKKQG